VSEVYDFSEFPILQGERLRLRQMTPADAEAMMALFSDPQVLAFLNMEPTDTLDKALGLIGWFEQMYSDHEAVTWAVTLPEDDRLIGTAGTYAWDRDDRHVDIGFHILPSLWNRGYGTEAAQLVVRWCFENLDVHRVQGDCTEGNTGSERVMLKCGFRHEGTWRESCWEHGRFVNIKQFGLLRHEAEF
jgi:ribosomal-protein-alanine N-acetyltransferase